MSVWEWLRAALLSLADVAWLGVAVLLDAAGGLGALGTALVLAAWAGLLAGLALSMQRRLVAAIAADPRRRVGFLAQEGWSFLPAWPLVPFVFLARGSRTLWRRLAGVVRPRPVPPAAADGPAAAPEPPPFLAASLGPSFLLGALPVCALYLLALAAAPLLALRLDAADGTPVWQALLIGHRPELGAHLPLDSSRPFLALLLFVLAWGTVWWWSARLVRLLYWRRLGGDLLAERDRQETLVPWRRWLAVRHLVAPSGPYRRWSAGLLAAALPLLAWAWVSLGAGVRAADLAVALVLWSAWSLHLVLSGAERLPARPQQDGPPPPPKERGAGWPEVRADLAERLQIETPPPFRPPRPIARLEPVAAVADQPLLSTLLDQLVPASASGERRLTAMQRDELARLARLGHVHTRPAPESGRLTLEPTAEEDREERRHRVVLAPEGSGKTTLAVLAAADHVLVHARSVLLIARGDEETGELHQRLARALDPTTLRWNLRVRRFGDDLAEDVGRHIVPDVVVASLHDLTVGILDQVATYATFLGNLGLVIVDDVESYAGAVETHAQLAFRRLALTAAKLLGVAELGPQTAPLFLALGTDSMYQTGAWVQALCGFDAEVERYAATAGGERCQELYRLSDFRAPTGERLDLPELVDSCERLGVPWHYRRARDGRRRLGRSALLLRDEPAGFRADPQEAAVVLVEGAWSEVRREIERLAMAGCRFPSGPCALVTLCDPDEEMAFTQRDEKLSLAAELATLPRPVLRPPRREVVGRHLASDLTQSWSEVADVLRVFGNATADALRALAAERALEAERRRDVGARLDEYVDKVYVRAQSRALAADEDDDRALLPLRVAQVELASELAVPVLDRTDLDRLALVDAASADLAYYPGRIFSDARGRFMVVHRASSEGGEDRGGEDRLPAGAILVEPVLVDDVSSPRRRIHVEVVESGASRRARGEAPGDDAAEPLYGPDPLLIGEHRLEVALARVHVRSEHFATVLVGPIFCEVRQRRLLEAESRRHLGASRLDTVGVVLIPNPAGSDADHALRFAGARLVAAAMRAVLPSLLRGAAESVEVALHVTPPEPHDEHVLGPDEGFVLFDLHAGGNGTARALHRDGVELLLRLVRLTIERVLYHDRLLALHDHWADGRPARRRASEVAEDAAAALAARRAAEREVRHQALTWLDSRLRPEGGAATFSAALGRTLAETEPGEGDAIDVGRCWWTRDGSVADLLWVKHRWRRDAAAEVSLDVGFDRRTAEEARDLLPASDELAAGRQIHRVHLADPGHARPDGTVWGAPGAVWRFDAVDERPRASQPGAGGDRAAALHEELAALALHAWPALGPLVRKLAEGSEVADAGATLGRYRLAAHLASFVAGIPTLRPGDDAAPRLRPPVETLLYRRGTAESKSLLLALLLRGCGVDAGLFVCLDERRALAAAALPEPRTAMARTVTVFRDEQGRFAAEEESTGEPEHYARSVEEARESWKHLEAWRREVDLDEPVPAWAELAAGPAEDEPTRLYVPIETALLAPPGWARPRSPDRWLFLPLVSVTRPLRPHLGTTAGSEESSDR